MEVDAFLSDPPPRSPIFNNRILFHQFLVYLQWYILKSLIKTTNQLLLQDYRLLATELEVQYYQTCPDDENQQHPRGIHASTDSEKSLTEQILM